MIEATIIADSISPQQHRITTFKLRYPKFIHGEFMTHRTISRNASSSRAIPVERMIAEVRSDAERAAPVFWGKNQKGMQAIEELNDTDNIYPNPYEPYSGPMLTARTLAKITWDQAARHAADFAQELSEVDAHKQITNRILEPFLHINVVATATEWDNFFGLRLHVSMQPEMRALAVAMWEAREASTPRELKPGDWHLPFVQEDGCVDTLKKVSVARCARVSYESFETGKRSTVEEDLRLYDRLTTGLSDPTQPLHASPMEHQATPDHWFDGIREEAENDGWETPWLHGNFVGWRQYRKMLPNEAVAPLPADFVQ